ncbi:MAG: class I SAM-dependent methyltransferase [Candidatus Woesebacteria bacterium]|jgi:cyclopropane fatty-acyl-phospholipid synthase-like methyltransferase
MDYEDKIINYYDNSQWLYQLFCYNDETLGMHFGFWEKNTKNRQEALVNENQKVIDLAGIKMGQKALDAGCGVGGTAIHIAKKTHAKVYAVSIAPN